MPDPLVIGNSYNKYAFEAGMVQFTLTGIPPNSTAWGGALANSVDGTTYTVPAGRKFVALVVAVGSTDWSKNLSIRRSSGAVVFVTSLAPSTPPPEYHVGFEVLAGETLELMQTSATGVEPGVTITGIEMAA